MPFVPLTPDEEKSWEKPCDSPEHDPPNMIVVTYKMKWICPKCGKATILVPNSSRMVCHGKE